MQEATGMLAQSVPHQSISQNLKESDSQQLGPLYYIHCKWKKDKFIKKRKDKHSNLVMFKEQMSNSQLFYVQNFTKFFYEANWGKKRRKKKNPLKQ